MVLVIPKDSSDVTDFKALTNGKIKKIALGAPKSVPAGQYAEEVFTKLNILDALKEKVVYAKDVKEVLTWVETGNADAGVVYETDARALGEFGATLMVAGNIPGKTQTIPVAIFFATEGGEMGKALTWVVLIFGISLVIMTLMNYWTEYKGKIIPVVGRK